MRIAFDTDHIEKECKQITHYQQTRLQLHTGVAREDAEDAGAPPWLEYHTNLLSLQAYILLLHALCIRNTLIYHLQTKELHFSLKRVLDIFQT